MITARTVGKPILATCWNRSVFKGTLTMHELGVTYPFPKEFKS